MSKFEIRRCNPAEFQAGLKCLHERLSPDQQASLVQTLDLLQGEPSVFEGLLVANADDKLVAATWVQFTPGNAAVVWPPAFESPAARDLVRAADGLLKEKNTALAQILISATEAVDEDLLAGGRFQRLVDLAYFTLERSNFPSYTNPGVLTYIPRATDNPERLQNLIKQSYVGTQDCPELNDLREPAEVIEGYKVQGVFDPENWFIVQLDTRDVGVLILAIHSPGENCELVYMGIAREARGQGFGEQIVRFAVEQSRLKGCERLVLAVDERNMPALEVYRGVGLVLWDRRTVYAHLCKT